VCLEFLSDERKLTSCWFGDVEIRYTSQYLINDVATAKNINTIVLFDKSPHDCESSTKKELVTKVAKFTKQVFGICIMSNVSTKCLQMMLETDPVTNSELLVAMQDMHAREVILSNGTVGIIVSRYSQ
jgi:hypothetical protein